MATNNSINLPEGLLGQLVTNTGSGFTNTTATYPSIATGTGTILRADGTNWVATTSTFADIYAASSLLYANGANNVAGLATANNGVLVTNGSGVPSIAAAIAAVNLIALGNSGVSTIGQTSFDLTTATGGTVTVTGLAFQPSLVIFLCAVNTGMPASIGVDNGTLHASLNNNYASVAGTWTTGTGSSMSLITGAGANQVGYITSFTSDGFVITFTKTGSPTGTALINYLAFK